MKSSLKKTLEQGQSFLLFGPRQTGKSSLLEEIFEELPQDLQRRYYFQLPQTREDLEQDPELMLREIDAQIIDKPIFIFIDEIQLIPGILDVMQFLIDHKKAIFACCGSSARQMRKFKANWLPGRLLLKHLFPLSYEEIQSASSKFTLNELLIFGTLPSILNQSDKSLRSQTLASYTHLYLDEEIRAEAATRNLPRFTKFLRLAALESGTSPNFSKIARQIGTSHTTIRDYYQILIDTLIVHSLPSFGKRRDSVLKSDRYYFFDIGVRNAAAQLPLDEGLLVLQSGVLFEHWIFLNLLAHFKDDYTFSYCRTKQGREVDLILENGQKRFALEIKTTKRPSLADFKGLDWFKKEHNVDGTLLICQIVKPQKFGHHVALPWGECVEYLKSELSSL